VFVAEREEELPQRSDSPEDEDEHEGLRRERRQGGARARQRDSPHTRTRQRTLRGSKSTRTRLLISRAPEPNPNHRIIEFVAGPISSPRPTLSTLRDAHGQPDEEERERPEDLEEERAEERELDRGVGASEYSRGTLEDDVDEYGDDDDGDGLSRASARDDGRGMRGAKPFDGRRRA
jgi:hypothetical protein